MPRWPQVSAEDNKPREWNSLDDMNRDYFNLHYAEWLLQKRRWDQVEGDPLPRPPPVFDEDQVQKLKGLQSSGNKRRKLNHSDQTPPSKPVNEFDGGNDAPSKASAAAEIEKYFPGAQALYDRLGESAPPSKSSDPDLPVPVKWDFVKSVDDMDKADFKACFELIEHTSGADYKASSIGWKPKKKKKEMRDPEMKYLLVRKDDGGEKEGEEEAEGGKGAVLGFISFMFTNDDPPLEHREVVYIYEVHLDDSLRGCGLGSKLIETVESAALHNGVTKTMLTVFKANRRAVGLYVKLGYNLDPCSPGDRVVRERVIKPDYVIMSKELAKVKLPWES